MPPGRKPGRGRGGASGRGRGKSAAEPAAELSTSVEAEVGNDGASSTVQSTIEATSHLMDVDHSPNSSPASIPTETPAPTPARPTAARPDPPAASSSHSSSTISKLPAKSSAKENAPAPSKFKPKFIRRTQDEREAMARSEMERKDKLAKEAAKAKRDLDYKTRGNRGGTRGRGSAMGSRRTTAQGIFGIAPEEMAKQGVPTVSTRSGGNFGQDEYVGGGRSGGGGGGGGGGSGGSGSSLKNGIQEPQYPLDADEQNAGKPIDIAEINLIESSDDDVVITGSRQISKPKDNQKGLRPIRLPRFAHKERAQVLNTDSSALATTVKKEDNDEKSDPSAVVAFDSTKVDSDDVQIKEEPTSPSSHRLRRRTQPQPSTSAISLDSPPTSPTLAKVKPPTSPNLNRKKAIKKPELVFASEEDKAEHARHLEDVAILARELGGLQSKEKVNDPKGKGPEVDANGDVTMSSAQEPPGDARAGRLYLFQFPPVLPKLYNPLTTDKPLPEGLIPVKQEHGLKDKKGPASPTLSKSKLKAGDRANDQAAIKPEPEEEILAVSAPDDPNARIPRDRVVQEPGYVGKLVVRESGKVELNWGGASLVVSRGIDASFLTMGVILDKNERGVVANGLGGTSDVEGKAMGMGQIMGKFVVRPDWEKMFGDEY